MADKTMDLSSRQPAGAARTEPYRYGRSSLGLFDEVERMFRDFGLGWRWPGHDLFRSSGRDSEWDAWRPNVEVFQRGDQFVARAELPGLGKDDIKVDVTDDSIVIQGERRREHQEEHGGVYRSERSYGNFRRMIPLPEGAMTDQAKAQFSNGVLEITMPAPPEHVTRGRRLEIVEAAARK